MQKFLVFTTILFGSYIFIRTTDGFRNNYLIEKALMTKIVVGFFIFQLALVQFHFLSLFLYVFLSLIPVVGLLFVSPILRATRAKKFSQQLPWLLNSLILNMKLGISLRQALLRTANQSERYLCEKLLMVRDQLSTLNTDAEAAMQLTQADPDLNEFVQILVLCEKEAHLSTQRLISYRHKLNVVRKTQQKVGQTLLQLRAQAYILTFLYFVLIFFVSFRFGFLANHRAIFISALIFAVGLTVTLLQGRKIRWTI